MAFPHLSPIFSPSNLWKHQAQGLVPGVELPSFETASDEAKMDTPRVFWLLDGTY
jgi:hypothetical protein